MTDFFLHSQLAADTVFVAALPLSRLLVMKDATYPWAILVPERPDVRDMHALARADQVQLMTEIAEVSAALESLTGAHKMNVAALGNMVPQLHVHVIARFRDDAAWPKPVWGAVPATAYAPGALEDFVGKLKAGLGR